MTDDERAILVFEEQRPRNDRGKEAAVRVEFGVSWVRYQQQLLRLVARDDVLAEFAPVAHRVQRVTADRVAARAARRFA
ncbi:DUF3263 domain-containing protein [Curtobacterium sp. MCPF17_003]|uniref:DUF3263 domain-containing protein n=1 Tax=Curtobacterium sp. MCPF17_003 TaxID=2175637 RepID=UPI0015E8AA00|nr:DUF3263 domain-containing protein [Curtobacterium sp. MCPF17_003]